MKILEVETFGRGGLTHYVDNLSRALAAKGHRVSIVTTEGYELDEGEPLPADVQIIRAIGVTTDDGATRPSSRLQGWRRKGRAVLDAFRVARVARRLRPDVIHVHCTNEIVLLHLALLRLLRIPLVFTAHQVTPHEPIRLQDSLYRTIHRLAPHIIAHSEFDRDRLRREFGVAQDRVSVIPHGEYGFFDRIGPPPDRDQARRELGLGKDDQVALFFGYIREYKGLDLLLEAWPAVAAAQPAARLLVAGDPVRLPPPRREELAAWAERLGALHHFGYVSLADVSRYFRAADVLVLPYREICQSGVLLAGLALGVPVIATSVGGLTEMLRDGHNAVVIPPESPEALARALVRVLGDPSLRTSLAAAGLQTASEHAWPAIGERTVQLFEALLADRG